jgi:hypothetical protein
LGIISSFVRRAKDLGHWRLTCQVIAEAAEPYLFRSLTISSTQRLEDVHVLLTTTPRYAAHVHHLRLKSDWVLNSTDLQVTGAAWLLGLLRAAENLRSFSAGSLVNFILHHQHTESVAAIDGLRHLQSLSLADSASRTSSQAFGCSVDMLQRLNGPLKSLTLALHFIQAYPSTENRPHVFNVLKRFAPTLETVRILDYIDIERWDAQHRLPLFGRLRNLRMDRAGSVHIPSLEAACPSLQKLTICRTHGDISRPPLEENVGHQLTAWTRLDVLAGTVSGVASLSFRGLRVGVLDLWYANSRQNAALAEILASLEVEMLRVSWPGPSSDIHSWLTLPRAGILVLELKTHCAWPSLREIIALVCLSFVYRQIELTSHRPRLPLTAVVLTHHPLSSHPTDHARWRE